MLTKVEELIRDAGIKACLFITVQRTGSYINSTGLNFTELKRM